MATVTAGYSFGVTETVTNAKLATLLTGATVTSIVNADIDAAAAIANSKLNLTSVSQAISMAGGLTLTTSPLTLTSVIAKMAKGADVASVAGNIALGDDGNYFDITGTNAITSITAKQAGTLVTLQFDSTATLTDGSNLKLNGNFTGAAEAQITLVSDGTNWFEVCRNNISNPSAATQAEQETASSTTTYVSPGRQQFHPSAAKAWCSFNGSGTPAMNGTPYNFSNTITDGGQGIWSLTFTNALSSANFVVIATSNDVSSSGIIINCTAKSSTGITVKARQTDTQGTVDPTWVDIVVYGDI